MRTKKGTQSSLIRMNLLSKVKQVRTETEATTTRREVNAQNQSTLQTERLVAMNQLIGNGVYGGIICFKCRRAGEPYDRVISHETKNCTHHQNGTNDANKRHKPNNGTRRNKYGGRKFCVFCQRRKKDRSVYESHDSQDCKFQKQQSSENFNGLVF